MEEKENIISIKNISKSFKKVKVLNNISFSIRRGKLTLFLGKNGAGKTTTIRIILGFLFPDRGKITLNEEKIGYIQQEPEFFDFLTGEEIIRTTAKIFKISDYKKKVLSIAEKLEFDINLLNRNTSKFSPGEKKKMSYIQTIITMPSLLIIDEPFSSLDPVGIKAVKNILIEFVEAGKTVFISSHLLFETEKLADDIIIIHRGEIKLDTEWNRKEGLEELFFKNI